VNLYIVARNDIIDLIDALGLTASSVCKKTGVHTFSFGGSGKIPLIPLSYTARVWGSFTEETCDRCCDDGRLITDERTTISIDAKAALVGSTAHGGINFGDGSSISYWYGIRTEVGLEGHAQGTLESDLCRYRAKQGRVCLTAGGFGAISVGGRGTVRLRNILLDVGIYGTGSGKITLKTCYVCSWGSCAWEPTKVCLGGDITAHLKVLFWGYSWNIWSGEDCFEM
jgi:hypothetical protein